MIVSTRQQILVGHSVFFPPYIDNQQKRSFGCCYLLVVVTALNINMKIDLAIVLDTQKLVAR